MKLEIGGDSLSSSDLRKLSGLLMETFGADSVALDASTETYRTFSIQTDASSLELETKLADMLDGAGYPESGYDLTLADNAAKVVIKKIAAPAEASDELMDIKDKAQASKVQQKLKDLGFLDGTVDGSWGKGSNKALEMFKSSDANLPDDSVWDMQTQTALFAT
jgi:hypothetical protein